MQYYAIHYKSPICVTDIVDSSEAEQFRKLFCTKILPLSDANSCFNGSRLYSPNNSNFTIIHENHSQKPRTIHLTCKPHMP